MNTLNRIACYLMSLVLFIALIKVDFGMWGDATVLGLSIIFIALPELLYNRPEPKREPPAIPRQGYMNEMDYVPSDDLTDKGDYQ